MKCAHTAAWQTGYARSAFKKKGTWVRAAVHAGGKRHKMVALGHEPPEQLRLPVARAKLCRDQQRVQDLPPEAPLAIPLYLSPLIVCLAVVAVAVTTWGHSVFQAI